MFLRFPDSIQQDIRLGSLELFRGYFVIVMNLKIYFFKCPVEVLRIPHSSIATHARARARTYIYVC